eukprot:s2356_g13.t1
MTRQLWPDRKEKRLGKLRHGTWSISHHLVCANDEEVSEVEPWQALNLPAAYIFFYERCVDAGFEASSEASKKRLPLQNLDMI